MKINASKLIIYSLLIINFKSMGQKVNNFSDFPWKSSKVNLMSQMLDLDSLKFNSEGDDFVVLENGRFGDYQVKYWCFYFSNDQLFEVTIVLDNILRNDTTAIYNLTNQLFVQHNNLTELIPDRYKSLLFLFDNSVQNLVGIIEINSSPISLGDRIRINFIYYPIFVETDILQNIKSIY